MSFVILEFIVLGVPLRLSHLIQPMSRSSFLSPSSPAESDFIAITRASTAEARKYLKQHNHDLGKALDSFFASSSSDLISTGFKNYFAASPEDTGSLQLSGASLVNLADYILTPLTDQVWLGIACVCAAKVMGEFTIGEWARGMRELSVTTPDDLKKSASKIRDQMTTDKAFGKKVYLYSFSYSLDQGTRNLQKADACALWELLLKPQGWRLYDVWMRFVDQQVSHSISKDVWTMVWALSEPNSFDSYEAEGGAWPCVIDEFVESVKGGM